MPDDNQFTSFVPEHRWPRVRESPGICTLSAKQLNFALMGFSLSSINNLIERHDSSQMNLPMAINKNIRAHQPGLLISVRDLAEAETAFEAGADLIDVKEPDRGSLGAADLGTLQAIAAGLNGRIPLSAALGELSETDRVAAQLPVAYHFAKYGLAGAAAMDWQTELKRRLAELPQSVLPVVVVYADWKRCFSPEPAEVIASAHQFGAGAMLIDTYLKDGSTSFDHLTGDQICEFIALARKSNLVCVLAGGLTIDLIVTAANFKPDYIAVRGAACDGDRRGKISGDAVRRLKTVIGQRVSTQIMPTANSSQ